MNDLLPPESAKWARFEGACRAALEHHGYGEIRTPILESTDLFLRGIGEQTDVVEKQMYTFPDLKGRSMTMRPEMTASCVRSYIQHSIGKKEAVSRWFYSGPMFRYERVQTGRYRQFNQIGVEAYGVAEPTVDAEQIAMLAQIYTEVGIGGLDVVVNSVGGADDRGAYRDALIAHLKPHVGELCGDCQRRLEKNPLRVLDCKVDGSKEIVASAPEITEFLSDESRAHFDGVRQGLADFDVEHRVDPRLVRGLDYYTGTVFEIISHSNALGAQATVVGGGRYDGLVESLGGPSTPAVGFALGVERNVMCMSGDAAQYVPRPDAFIMALGDEARRAALKLAHELRGQGLHIEVEHRPVNRKAQFKRSDALRPHFLATIDEESFTTTAMRSLKLRDADKNEEVIPFEQLGDALLKARAKRDA